MSRRKESGDEAVTGAQLRETERGLAALLRAKGFPAPWIDRHSLDLVAQAASEYAAWMKAHEPEGNPVGWLITCAYRRALNLLTSQRRRPPAASVEDAALALADESLPTPEEAVLPFVPAHGGKRSDPCRRLGRGGVLATRAQGLDRHQARLYLRDSERRAVVRTAGEDGGADGRHPFVARWR
ncbi:MAG TPA: hypothetical protein VN732_08200 [Solirubrobacterales bacterium]|nr:hypothetical protein [Solirubrobacterales bacterium]